MLNFRKMNQGKTIIGFIGVGGIARSHAYSLNSLKYFYNDAPQIEFAAACSATPETREQFAGKYGFKKSLNLDTFISDNQINTVFILGPNKVHYDHLKASADMKNVRRIYLEKPVCSNAEEENAIREIVRLHPEIKIQVGFQFLFSSSIREMLKIWQSGKLGKPVHFDLKYYHGDYLKKDYREKRTTRLTPAPDGGAMADLGSHSISLLMAFLGKQLRIISGLQSGHFNDVRADSDLFSLISICDEASGAAGTISASRISAGSGDYFSFELFGMDGALRFTSAQPDSFEYFLSETGAWNKKIMASNYKPVTSFPSEHVPAGWLRSMIHAHYVFLTGNDNNEFVPDIFHGLEVQRIVRETAGHLKNFRELRSSL